LAIVQNRILPMHKLSVAENLPKQQFKAYEPNALWVSDITYVPTDEGWLYLLGRTGSVNKNVGALTFVTSVDAGKISVLERLLDTPLERLTLQGFDYTKPAPKVESERIPRQSAYRKTAKS